MKQKTFLGLAIVLVVSLLFSTGLFFNSVNAQTNTQSVKDSVINPVIVTPDPVFTSGVIIGKTSFGGCGIFESSMGSIQGGSTNNLLLNSSCTLSLTTPHILPVISVTKQLSYINSTVRVQDNNTITFTPSLRPVLPTLAYFSASLQIFEYRGIILTESLYTLFLTIFALVLFYKFSKRYTFRQIQVFRC